MSSEDPFNLKAYVSSEDTFKAYVSSENPFNPKFNLKAYVSAAYQLKPIKAYQFNPIKAYLNSRTP